MNRSCIQTFLLLGVVTTSLGCSRTVTGGFDDSPDKKLRMYGRVYGALGKAFLDETRKTVRISIVTNDSKETLIFRREIHVKGSDVRWNCTWDKAGNVSVVVFNHGPGVYWEDALKAGTPSNLLATVLFIRDKQTGTFNELK